MLDHTGLLLKKNQPAYFFGACCDFCYGWRIRMGSKDTAKGNGGMKSFSYTQYVARWAKCRMTESPSKNGCRTSDLLFLCDDNHANIGLSSQEQGSSFGPVRPLKRKFGDMSTNSGQEAAASNSSEGSCFTEQNKRVRQEEEDAFLHLKRLEQNQRVLWGYVTEESSPINTISRGKLVLQLFQWNKVQTETIFLATTFLDVCLSRLKNYINKDVLELLSVTCMVAARKFDEINCCSNLVRRVSESLHYKADDICTMERIVLKAIDYRCAVPTTMTFMRYYLEGVNASASVAKMAEFLACLALLDYEMLRFRPAVLAASAITLACELEGECLLQRTAGCRFTTKASEYCQQELLNLYLLVHQDNSDAKNIRKLLEERCGLPHYEYNPIH